MNYELSNQNISETVYTPYIIKPNNNNNYVTYIDLVKFGHVTGFGYLSGYTTFDTWQEFITSVHEHLRDLYSRLGGTPEPDPTPEPVNIAVTGVSLPTVVSVINNATYQLTATVYPSNATNKSVTWSSSNTSVATVSSSGKVTAKSVGNATITVTTVDGGYTATTRIEVISGAPEPTTDYYWYIGVENPTSISNIQSSNTVGGWHKINTSLSSFKLDTNNDQVHISETRVPYYIVIPNELEIYDSLGDKFTYGYDTVTCNISGYKAYKWSKEKSGSAFDGVRNVTGLIIKIKSE